MDKATELEQAWFSQDRYRCKLDWGRRGAKAAAERGDVLVVVDTLSFSTTVATATHHGVLVYPCQAEAKHALAERVGAEMAVKRGEVPQLGRFSLSPQTFRTAARGKKVVLDSPNGSTCCCLAKACPHVVLGCLNNARAVARFVTDVLGRGDLTVTLLACGERWLTDSDDGPLRMAVEDYLGAGAILSFLGFDKSPEALICEAGFRAVSGQLEDVLLHCGSGVELCEKGYAQDVRDAARLNSVETIPVLQPEGFFASPSPFIL